MPEVAGTRRLRVMADYECFPLWLYAPDGCTNLDPSTLPISEALAEQLIRWAEEYDATLDRADPAASGFPDDAAEQDFNDRGRRLARRLAGETAGRFAVEYFDLLTARVHTVAVQGRVPY